MSNPSKITLSIVGVAVIGAATAAAVMLLPPSEQASPNPAAASEKCFGAAKAGENDCMAEDASHTCAGMAAVNYNGQDYKSLPAGSCTQMGGRLEPFAGTLALSANGKLAVSTP